MPITTSSTDRTAHLLALMKRAATPSTPATSQE